MSGRYQVVRRAALKVGFEDDWEEPWVSPVVPEVSEHVASFTGLVDMNGDPTMRLPRAIGFGAVDGW